MEREIETQFVAASLIILSWKVSLKASNSNSLIAREQGVKVCLNFDVDFLDHIELLV